MCGRRPLGFDLIRMLSTNTHTHINWPHQVKVIYSLTWIKLQRIRKSGATVAIAHYIVAQLKPERYSRQIRSRKISAYHFVLFRCLRTSVFSLRCSCYACVVGVFYFNLIFFVFSFIFVCSAKKNSTKTHTHTHRCIFRTIVIIEPPSMVVCAPALPSDSAT